MVNKVAEWRAQKDLRRHTVMTDEEMLFINDCIAMLNDNIGHMNAKYAQWKLEETAYSSDQEKIEGLPNSRMNVINASIEGEVSQIVNPNQAITAKGESPEDEEFAEWGRICLDWAFRKNKSFNKVKEHERSRNKFGNAWLKVVWNAGYAGGQGLSELKMPPLNKVFIDTKITSYLDKEDAEYICETINLSKSYAIAQYGEAKADLIDYGMNQYRDQGVFQEDISNIDDRSWTLIQWWSKPNGILRLQEFSACGILLYDSHKEGTRKTQNKDSKKNPKPYYKYVDNRYPYFFTVKYTKLGDFYGFGDAKLLMPLQNCINEMWDKIRIQMRPNIVLIDVNAGIDVSTFDDNSFNPYYFDGTKLRGGAPIHSVAWGQLASDVWKFLDTMHQEAQRIIRFSDIMTGQRGTTQTATEAAIQQSQGNSHADTEKPVLESTLADVALYMLALMMEFFKGSKAFRIPGKKGKYEWIDFSKMRDVPALIPATQDYKDKFKAMNPEAPTPEWSHVTDEKGNVMTKSVELDIEVSVGSGLPKNKAFLWQMVEKIGQIMTFDTASGQTVQKPLLNYKELREFIKTYLGIPIQEDDIEMEKFMEQYRAKQQQTQQQPMNPQGMSTPTQPMQNPNVMGLGAGGGAMTSQNPQEGSVTGGNSQTA